MLLFIGLCSKSGYSRQVGQAIHIPDCHKTRGLTTSTWPGGRSIVLLSATNRLHNRIMLMRYARSVRLLPVLGLIAGMAACSGRDANADTDLARDLALATQMDPAEPTLSDTTPATPAPAPAPAPRPQPPPRTQPRPAPQPAAPQPTAPKVGAVSIGARMVLASDSRVCTNTHKVGDRFVATLRDGVFGSNGAVIPAGSKAEVEVTALKRSENVNDEIVIGLVVRAVTVNGTRYETDAETKEFALEKVRASNDAKKVVGGAAVGAVVGQIIGRDTRSTVIGAATGAAAGTAAAVATANHEGCVPESGRIEVVLTSPLTIDLAS